LFFAWNGMIISAEYIIGKAYVFQLISEKCPKIVVSFLVVLTALPIAHWFTGDYIQSDFFECVHLGFFIIKRV